MESETERDPEERLGDFREEEEERCVYRSGSEGLWTQWWRSARPRSSSTPKLSKGCGVEIAITARIADLQASTTLWSRQETPLTTGLAPPARSPSSPLTVMRRKPPSTPPFLVL